MNITKDAPLGNFSTMRLGGKAAYLAEVNSREDIASAYNWAKQNKLPYIMIGGGSNIVWKDEGYPGLVIVNKIKRFEVFEEDAENYYVTIGAGEIWDEAVEQTVKAGATGIEALSLIPGTAGGTPVQNVGAYGQEIAEVLVSVEAFDTRTGTFVNIPAADCAFGYRTSRFKTTDKSRFLISALTLHLIKGKPLPPYYGSVQKYFDDHQMKDITPEMLREAVIAIRTAKLPDPNLVANTGSFFSNPIVDEYSAAQIIETYPNAPHWSATGDQVKLSAAWLIEQAGFKDYHDADTGMATWPRQPLVFINEHAKSTADLLKFRQKVVDAVKAKFNITLQQEPELLP